MLKSMVVSVFEFFRTFKETGMMFPTSKWAARAMVHPLRDEPKRNNVVPFNKDGHRQPLKILELGPGTGTVTYRILENLSEGDELTVCEINPRFMSILRSNLVDKADYREHRKKITFYQCAAQELPETEKYDVIICSLPFLNFEMETVAEIFAKLRKLSHEETVMTYYEYIGLKKVGIMVSPPKRKARLSQIDRFFKSVFKQHLINREKIWANVLPINVYMLKGFSAHEAGQEGQRVAAVGA